MYSKLEEQACELRGYAPARVPALLRTADYALALITASHPAAGVEEIDRLVHECRARQMLVTRVSAPLSVTLVLSEALLRCAVADALVMAEQLREPAESAAPPNVRLRVMPFSAGLHLGLPRFDGPIDPRYEGKPQKNLNHGAGADRPACSVPEFCQTCLGR
ncbi:MAG TPA: DUF5753 domain-containing protein [Streptosporangiaceae bacterium]|nr:DUF5753 domain-containing protein [Streptosporangiaceae bacterium]